jgi:hypothetical protein
MRTIMSKKIVLVGFAFAILIIVTVATMSYTSPSDNKGMDNAAMVKRGEYLVTMGGCNDCHSPKIMTDQGPMPDPRRLLSGHPANAKLPRVDVNSIGPGKWVLFSEDLTCAVGPWGMSFSANLTPDDQTGIGLWKEENFIQALRTGKHMGAGRAILPPMPWFNFMKAQDEDLKAIFAYLKSLPPVKNPVPVPIPFTELSTK